LGSGTHTPLPLWAGACTHAHKQGRRDALGQRHLQVAAVVIHFCLFSYTTSINLQKQRASISMQLVVLYAI
jgi:hypothetical protein